MKAEFICAGEYGGIASGNTSCYLLQFKDSNNFIALDGGSPIDGIWAYNSQNPIHKINIHQIEAFLLTHAHLDHIIGFVIMTPGLYPGIHSGLHPKMKVITTKSVLEVLDKHLFNDYLWPKVLWGDEDGVIDKYCIDDHDILHLKESDCSVSALPIQHGNYGHYDQAHEKYEDSTVFIVKDNRSKQHVIYFGDVTSESHIQIDATVQDLMLREKLVKQKQLAQQQLDHVWDKIAELIIDNTLVAIFIECANGNSAKNSFGHLNASLLQKEFSHLLEKVKQTQSDKDLSDINIIITHRKPSVTNDPQDLEAIKEEVIAALEPFGFAAKNKLIFPAQGHKYCLS